MKLKKLQVRSFRNISSAELFAGPRFNIIHGKNGQGKTNLLESIFLLGTLKSFKLGKNRDLIKRDNPHALIKGWVERSTISREITLIIEPEGKKARVDNKIPKKAADFFGCLNVVVFSPEEIAMARGVPELRRKYLDRAIFNGDITYLSLHQEYYKILKSRNILLKKGEILGLEVWTEQLAELGGKLIAKRIAFVDELRDLVSSFYQQVAGAKEKVDMRYRPYRLEKTGDWQTTLHEMLLQTAQEEKRLRTTVVGPHRDDLEFSLNDSPLRHFGSQGEQRTFVLALKMAEIEYLAQKFGNPPILLLDDMTSELDHERNRNLISFLNSKEMQVFITTTRLENINLDGIDKCTTFLIEEGSVIN